nr:uncharacterized protein LOC108119289 [Drosophila bipectinata]
MPHHHAIGHKSEVDETTRSEALSRHNSNISTKGDASRDTEQQQQIKSGPCQDCSCHSLLVWVCECLLSPFLLGLLAFCFGERQHVFALLRLPMGLWPKHLPFALQRLSKMWIHRKRAMCQWQDGGRKHG